LLIYKTAGGLHPNGTILLWRIDALVEATRLWVFVFDVRGKKPVRKQLINIPNTYQGLLWDPSGTRFYVAGGIDDRVFIYKSSGTGASADGTYTPDAPFVLLNHDQPANVPIQEFPTGGLFVSTPINHSSPATEFLLLRQLI
jgi:hypothetical protein